MCCWCNVTCVAGTLTMVSGSADRVAFRASEAGMCSGRYRALESRRREAGMFFTRWRSNHWWRVGGGHEDHNGMGRRGT